MDKILELIEKYVSVLNLDAKIEAINIIKSKLHSISPFINEPVDCVLWIKNNLIIANDYNPNTVAPPEMELLYQSILQDGYTQPIVSWRKDSIFEVVDGFHRNKVGKEKKDIENRIFGYLPLSIIKTEREDKSDRIAATIRHNRARGKHNVESMSDIVLELARRNWNDEKIAKNLGMDSDEVLRLKQITGIAEMFKDEDFSKAWTIDEIGEENGPDEEIVEEL